MLFWWKSSLHNTESIGKELLWAIINGYGADKIVFIDTCKVWFNILKQPRSEEIVKNSLPSVTIRTGIALKRQGLFLFIVNNAWSPSSICAFPTISWLPTIWNLLVYNPRAYGCWINVTIFALKFEC